MTNSISNLPIDARASELANGMHNANCRTIDRLFAWLMLVQWIAGICTAIFITPYTWIGARSLVHQHVWAAILLGGILSAVPIWLAIFHPGKTITRHVIAVSQALWGALLIHLSGGRLETHFHVFGSLAFIAFYRDWRVLVTMTVVVAIDHAVRGVFFPLSVYGVLQESPYRWLEHVGWVLCENVVLFLSCRRGLSELMQICSARAELELTNRKIEERVSERTCELRDTKDFFRSVLDSIHAHVCVLDHNGQIVEANHLWRQTNNQSAQHACGIGDNYIEKCQTLAGEESSGAADVAEAIQTVLRNRSQQLVPEFAIDFDGDTSWYQVHVSPVLGHRRGAAVVARINVSERIVAERELQTTSDHLERMSLIAKYTDNAVVILTTDGHISLVNEGFERLYEYSSEEVMGRKPHEFLLGEESDPDTVVFMNHQITRGCGYDVELCKYRKSGEAVWVSIEVRPIYSADGRLLRFISMARDITQRREREQSLQLLREAIDNANDAMFILKPDGGIVDVNITAGRLLGYTRRELLQQSMSDIESGFTNQSMLKRWQAAQDMDVDGLSGTFIASDGASFPVEVSTVPVTYCGQAYFCAFAQDISERRKAEAEHERLNVELRNVARQTGMAEVAADVLHNVGNALNSINVSVQSLQRQINSKSVDILNRTTQTIWDRKDDLDVFLKTDKQGCMFPNLLQQLGQQFTKERKKQGEEVDSLIGKIDHVKEVVAGQKAFSQRRAMSEAILPANLFQEALRMHSFSVGDVGVLVENDFADIDEVFLEKHLVMQILINLIKNGREAVLDVENQEPRVVLSTRVENECVCFQVEDNGIGIAEANLVEIFQHGFTTKETGHGFGLHSCANLAQEMGGTLTVQSEGIGCGATFVLKLPLQANVATEPVS